MDWIVGTTDGKLQVGAQLCTLDGRRIGNGFIINIIDHGLLENIYIVLTDAGNVIRFTKCEIMEVYHPPQFLGELSEIISRFKRK